MSTIFLLLSNFDFPIFACVNEKEIDQYIFDQINSPSKEVRLNALETLVTLLPTESPFLDRGSKSLPKTLQPANLPQVLEVLINLLRDEDAEVRNRASVCLFNIGYKAKPASAELAKFINDENRHVRIYSAASLILFSPDNREAREILNREVSTIISGLRPTMAGYAMDGSREILLRLGTPAVRPLVDELERKVDDPLEMGLQYSVAQTLGLFGKNAEPAIPALVAILRNSDHPFRDTAADSLGMIGPTARVAIPELTSLLKNPSSKVRRAAAKSLWKLDPGNEEALSTLMDLIRDPDGHDREWAIATLGQFGPAAKSALPLLTKVLEDESPQLRKIATESIAAIRGSP